MLTLVQLTAKFCEWPFHERTCFLEDSVLGQSVPQTDCYPYHRTVPSWSMALQSLYDCRVFNITSHSKTLVQFGMKGTIHPETFTQESPCLEIQALDKSNSPYLIAFHKRTIATKRTQTVCISKLVAFFSMEQKIMP
ncbi:hypothetical protein BS333_10790 [Vibrio azureus]|nr:hypothetical protein BS333_10790 [Vibrio azureus]